MESISICNDKGILFLAGDPDEDESFDLAQAVFTWVLRDQYNVTPNMPTEPWQHFD
jgi:hypothetical protein